MTIDSDIRDQAYQFFIEEAPELLQDIESSILALRQTRDTTTIHTMMRAAHSLKGSSASVGLDAIKTIAHRLETIFRALYSDTVSFDDGLETQLLQAYDCLRLPLIEQLQYGRFDAEQALAAAVPILSQLESELSEAIAATANFLPSSADFGIDMAQSIFEVDVAEGLEHLAAIVTDPSGRDMAAELRAQVDIFSDFAELLGLSGFGDIAKTTLQALDRHPEQALEIAQLALADFRAGQREVLNQPGSRGGTPSAALLAWVSEHESDVSYQGEINRSQDEAAELLNQLELEGDPDQVLAELGLLDQTIDDQQADDRANHHLVEADSIALTQSDLAPEDDLFSQAFDQLGALADLELGWDSPDETAAPEVIGEAIPEESSADNAFDAGSLPLQLTASPPPPPVTGTTVPVLPGLTVRVEADRLNRMDNLLGELTINRNGVELQNSQLRGAVKELTGRFSRFQALVENLRRLSDQMLVSSERQQSRSRLTNGYSRDSLGSQQDEFDSLEMDNYTQLYTQTQTLLEELLQVEETVEDISLFSYQSDQMLGRHRKMLSQMQDELMLARMIPLAQVLNRFPRVLRDLSSQYGKPVALDLSGTDILVDKAVLSKLYDPLVQLLRNSFDHGIEPTEDRRQQQKPEAGHITIQARYQGRQVILEVRDDGRGLNFERIRDRTVELGWLGPEAAATASPEQLSQFIFEPGVSTAQQVSELSGRGVGLDIVRDQIQTLNGSITVTSTPGVGTVFTLTLPQTLSIINLLICFVGATPLAIRSDSIQEILVPTPDQLRQVGAQQFLSWQDQDIPAYKLAALLNYNCLIPEVPPSRVLATVPTPTNWKAPMLVLSRGDQSFALEVDRLVTEQEMVVKPFGIAIQSPIFAYGCTVLGDGSLVPVIDGPVLLDNMIRRGLVLLPQASEQDALAALAQQNATHGPTRATLQKLQATTILVVDDAVTLRRTLSLSLERTGYRVLQARDGQEALEQLQQNPTIQAIICDVEMPNMNGFEFLTKRRETAQFAQIPTLMLTSRGNDKHRRLAMKLGAVDYLTKPYLEQELLTALATHMGTQEAV
jgi:chemotaxis family two-component system sensor histidine kinase/response regulator PixL